MAAKMLSFPELFYNSTMALSSVYYPTSPLMMHHLIRIARHLKNCESVRHFRDVVVPMIDKYLLYWRGIPFLYYIASILDPRAKFGCYPFY
jgi:hypothetical protein